MEVLFKLDCEHRTLGAYPRSRLRLSRFDIEQGKSETKVNSVKVRGGKGKEVIVL